MQWNILYVIATKLRNVKRTLIQLVQYIWIPFHWFIILIIFFLELFQRFMECIRFYHRCGKHYRCHCVCIHGSSSFSSHFIFFCSFDKKIQNFFTFSHLFFDFSSIGWQYTKGKFQNLFQNEIFFLEKSYLQISKKKMIKTIMFAHLSWIKLKTKHT